MKFSPSRLRVSFWVTKNTALRNTFSTDQSHGSPPPLEAWEHVGGRNHEAASGTQAGGAGHTN